MSRYIPELDPLGTPKFPIPIDDVFRIKSVAFKVHDSIITGAGLGLFVHSSIKRATTILHYGGDKYSYTDWKKLCTVQPRLKKYSMQKDPSVSMREMVYIVGDVHCGNVAGFINSSRNTNAKANVCYVFSPDIPPWSISKKKIEIAEYGYICVETIDDICEGEELFADYEFD